MSPSQSFSEFNTSCGQFPEGHTEILNTEVTNPDAKRHKNVTVPELELALKEFILIYQNRYILSEAILIEKAKQIASGLGVPEGTLTFSPGWLYKFKRHNGVKESFMERYRQLI
nr:6798_t:CDS:2 [Entrophospora candida]